jgi:hypothetical protein
VKYRKFFHLSVGMFPVPHHNIAALIIAGVSPVWLFLCPQQTTTTTAFILFGRPSSSKRSSDQVQKQ